MNLKKEKCRFHPPPSTSQDRLICFLTRSFHILAAHSVGGMLAGGSSPAVVAFAHQTTRNAHTSDISVTTRCVRLAEHRCATKRLLRPTAIPFTLILHGVDVDCHRLDHRQTRIYSRSSAATTRRSFFDRLTTTPGIYSAPVPFLICKSGQISENSFLVFTERIGILQLRSPWPRPSIDATADISLLANKNIVSRHGLGLPKKHIFGLASLLIVHAGNPYHTSLICLIGIFYFPHISWLLQSSLRSQHGRKNTLEVQKPKCIHCIRSIHVCIVIIAQLLS